MTKKKLNERTMENLLTLLLYRLGGEQVFSENEIRCISDDVGGATLTVEDDKIILRCRTIESMKKLKDVKIATKKKVPAANTNLK
jgi:hypothetical protein